MAEFFRGWRRKAGSVTLALACVFFAAWSRGQTNPNAYSVPLGSLIQCELELKRSRLLIMVHRYVMPTANQQVTLDDDGTVIIEDKPIAKRSSDDHDRVARQITKQRFPNGVVSVFQFTVCVYDTTTLMDASYWYLIVPLTFLSAWLLLWKPRRRKARIEPVTDQAA